MKGAHLFSFILFICSIAAVYAQCDDINNDPNQLPLSLQSCIGKVSQFKQVPTFKATLSETFVSMTPTPSKQVNVTSYIEITDIYPGKTYTFTTCTGITSPNPGFDPVLMLAYPDGTILDFQDDCTTTGCSLLSSTVSFIHDNSFYKSVYLYILAYPENSLKPVCLTSFKRLSVPLYTKVDVAPPCNTFTIQCDPNDVVYPLSGSGIAVVSTSTLTIPAGTSLCGTTSRLVVDNIILDPESNSKTFSCNQIGYHNVEVDSYAGSCSTRVLIVDNTPPTAPACPIDDAAYFLVEGNQTCFGTTNLNKCSIQMKSIPFPAFTFTDNCDSYYDVDVSYTFSKNGVEVGESVVVIAKGTDEGENSVSVPCTLTPIGFRVLVNNEEDFWANEEYDIYFNFYHPTESISGIKFLIVSFPGTEYYDTPPYLWYSIFDDEDYEDLYDEATPFDYFVYDGSGSSVTGNAFVAEDVYVPIDVYNGVYYLVSIAELSDGSFILGYIYPIVDVHGSDYIPDDGDAP